MAPHRETNANLALGRFVNHDLAEHHAPMNADVPDIGVIFAFERDNKASSSGA